MLCLEVAEHLPPERAESFIAELCELAPLVIFSAAIPGQGGINHLNEQWPDYWASLFWAFDYLVSGRFRYEIWELEQVENWYRQNLLIAWRSQHFPWPQEEARTGGGATLAGPPRPLRREAPVIFGITMVKDEADIIGLTLPLMLEQVDALIVADNGSTDGTAEILGDFAAGTSKPVYLTEDSEPAYYQSAKMSALARCAYQHGAEWVVPFDADEVWCPRGGRITISDLLENVTADVVPAMLYRHLACGNGPLSPWMLQEPAPLPKVACRPVLPVTIELGNHDARFPTPVVAPKGLLEVHHFPYRSPEQMIRKTRNGAAAIALTDLPEHQGEHWRHHGLLSDEQLIEAFYEHYFTNDPEHDERLVEWRP